jgi:hypothetical protein
VRFKVVAGDSQYDSAELRQRTIEAFKAETPIPTIKGKGDIFALRRRYEVKLQTKQPI